MTEILIIVGFIGLVLKRTKIHFDRDFFMISSASIALLVALIAVPGLANTLNMNRFYHILLFFLAPLSIIGAEVIANLLSKRRKEMVTIFLLLSILVPYFLFQTGFVYEATKNESWSLSLSSARATPYRLYYDLGYVNGKDVFGAEWIHQNMDLQSLHLYADEVSIVDDLQMYGSIYAPSISEFTNITQVSGYGTVYLSSMNVLSKTIVTPTVSTLNQLHFLSSISKVYTNGGSEIYKNTNSEAV
jgi:uncharacterized membrane protein